MKACHAILAEAKRLIESEGLVVKIVSGGGSSNYIDALNTGVLTELQAGGGALTDNLYYNKANLKDHGHQVGFFVLTQIMSVPKDQSRAMADAGHKALGWHPFGNYFPSTFVFEISFLTFCNQRWFSTTIW